MLKPKAYSYVRFSTPEQEKGDSLRRQIQNSEKWAINHGYELDETIKIEDRGLSAHKGDHRKKGSLGKFLALVVGGKIVPGSVLIIESLDRLSREKVLDAFDTFRDIIKAKIKVVTLIDKMEYTEESLNKNYFALMQSLSLMAMANKESEQKSKRLSEAWKSKRNNIDKIKLTKTCPAWLKLNENKTAFMKVEAACQVVEKVFQLKLSGKGSDRIAKELNGNLDVWKPPRKWRKSYINKILRTRAVIGEFQPHKKQPDGTRKPEGEPSSDYFPAIVSKDLFYAVQKQIKRNKHFGGKTGKVHNLFSYLAKCGLCGAPMQFVDKGSGWRYLVCDNARRGIKCKKFYIPYGGFEALILKYAFLDISDLLPGNEDKSELPDLLAKLSSDKAEIEDIKIKIDNLSGSIENSSDPRTRKTLESKMSERFDEKEKIEREQLDLESEIERIETEKESIEKNVRSITELFKYMDSIDEEDELVTLRLKLRDTIRQVIDRIDLFPPASAKLTADYERFKGYFIENESDSDLIEICETDFAFGQIKFKRPVTQGIHFDPKDKSLKVRWSWIRDSEIPKIYRN